MIHIKRATIIQINIFRCEDIIFSHERISYRFYQFVNTQYTSNFCIVKVYTSCCKEVTVSLIGHFRLLLGVEDTVDVGQKNKRTNKTIKTIGLWGGVLLWCVLSLLHQQGVPFPCSLVPLFQNETWAKPLNWGTRFHMNSFAQEIMILFRWKIRFDKEAYWNSILQCCR